MKFHPKQIKTNTMSVLFYRLCFVFLVLIPYSVSTQGIPARPSPPRLVNDFAGVLTASQIMDIEQRLVEFNNTTANQIVVAIVPDFGGYDRAEFATNMGHQWGVGQKEFDNGVVVLIKPRQGTQRGEAFIAVGYGLEPVITDAATRRIIEQEMIPHFRVNDYYSGINAATGVIMSLAAKEFSSDQYAGVQQPPVLQLLPFLMVMLLMILTSVSASRNRRTLGRGASLWPMLFLLGSMGSGRGSYGNFSSGSGSFGGFGGGGFGGGGAGGSW